MCVAVMALLVRRKLNLKKSNKFLPIKLFFLEKYVDLGRFFWVSMRLLPKLFWFKFIIDKKGLKIAPLDETLPKKYKFNFTFN